MIIKRAMHDQWLSNTFLVGDRFGGVGVLVDASGPVAPLLERIDEQQLTLTHVLLTHHHFDHVAGLGQVLESHPEAVAMAHPLERELITDAVDAVEPGERLETGELAIEVIHTPGHTAGGLSYLVGGSEVFTGDTLFKGSVGGVRGPGHTTYTDLKDSIMSRLMKLPPETKIQPGHTDSSTVADEWEQNPFIRIWRGLDSEGSEPCTFGGEPATLILFAVDYDGGHKAWIRWPDGRDDIVPGSMVERGVG